MAIREGVWDCPYCDATGIRGPLNECSNCGAPRDKDVKIYLPDDAAEVTEDQALAKAKAGADWRCAYCGRENPVGQTICQECGAAPDGSGGKRETGIVEDKPKPAPRPAARPAKKKGGILWIVLGVILAIGLGLYFFVFRIHAETVKVLSHEWERVIQIEKFKKVTEQGWENEVPHNARVLSRNRELFKTEKIKVGSKKVKAGKKDLGNGYFEDVFKDEPIYEEKKIFKDKVSYEVERWMPERKAKAAGSDLMPAWPTVQLNAQERQTDKTETLKIVVELKGGERESFSLTDMKRWKWYENGKSYKAEVRASGGISELEKPAEQP